MRKYLHLALVALLALGWLAPAWAYVPKPPNITTPNTATTRFWYNKATYATIYGDIVHTGDTRGLNLSSTGSTAGSGDISFSTGSAAVAEAMRIKHTGNVLIGTTTDGGQKLQVNGASALGATTFSGSATFNAAGTASVPANTLAGGTNALSVQIGSGSTAGFTADQYGGAARFNGAGVTWGDLSFYPTGGGAGAQGHFRFSTSGSSLGTAPNAKLGVGELYAASKVGVGTMSPTAKLHLAAGAAAAGSAPLKLTAGTNLTTAEAGAVEYDGTFFYATPVTTRERVFTGITATAGIDFASIPAGSTAELTVTVAGAATGDAVTLGAPATLEAGLVATGIVTAANTVSVRLANVTAAAIDPALATWRATVLH